MIMIWTRKSSTPVATSESAPPKGKVRRLSRQPVWPTALLWLLLAGCGGPMPPSDPFHLAEAKDALSRGNHWFQRGCPAEADRYFELGLEQARMADDVSLIINGLNARGAALVAQGRLNQAALILEQALELSAADPERPELHSVLGNLGLLALKADRKDDARELWREAVAEAERKGLNPILFHCNLARLEMDAGDKAAFRLRLAQAMALLEADASERAAADAYNLAATAAMEDGDDVSAETYLNDALTLDRKNENQVGLAQDLETLASLQIKTGRFSEAAASLDRAFYLWAALGDKTALNRTMQSLSALSKSSGAPKNVEVYQRIQRNPAAFDPINRLCPCRPPLPLLIAFALADRLRPRQSSLPLPTSRGFAFLSSPLFFGSSLFLSRSLGKASGQQRVEPRPETDDQNESHGLHGGDERQIRA
jgi:Tfp pilus assembly protein PilF